MNCDWFSKWANYAPDKVAVKEIGTERQYTYQQFNNAINSLCHHLSEEYNLIKGDRIIVLANFHSEYLSFLGAAQKMGLIIVPLNYRLSSKEIAYQIENAEPSLIIAEKEFSKLLDEVNQIDESRSLLFENLQQFIFDNQSSNLPFESVTIEESHPAFILYTSGTTGKPKGALYTHGMMLWNSLNTALRLQLSAEDVSINVMPPFHTGGWNVLTTPILHFGGTIILMPKFDSNELLVQLEQEAVSIFMLVPTMVRMLQESPLFQKTNFNSLRYLIVGGEALPISLIECWKQKGVTIRQGYGLTECGPNITSLEAKDAFRKRGSIGFPNFYVTTKLVNEKGMEAKINEKGELWINGPIVTPGYWRNAVESDKAIQDGWFKTGDILIKDEEGFLYVVDRIKNMYISGGENVYPAEIEACLLKHEAINEVCIIGVPDQKWGEVGLAFAVLKEGNHLSDEELLKYCLEHLAKFKVPKSVQFVKSLPKNDTGKIDRKSLYELKSSL